MITVLWRNERRNASHYEYGYLFANLFGQRAEDICENRVRTMRYIIKNQIEHYESYYGDAAEGSIDRFFLLFNR